MGSQIVEEVGPSCFVNKDGSLFLVSNQGFEHFKNLDIALEKGRKIIVSLLKEKEKFFNQLSEENNRKLLREISRIRKSFQKEPDFRFALRNNKQSFLKLVKDIEDIKIFYRQKRNEVILKIIEVRNLLLNMFAQMQSLTKIKEKNELSCKKITKELTSCYQHLDSYFSGEKFDYLLQSQLEEKMFYCQVHLEDATFVAPYTARFSKLQDFLIDFQAKNTDDYNINLLKKEINKLKKDFEYKVANKLQLH